MKTACFLLQTIVGAALIHGMALPVPPRQVHETTSADSAETTTGDRGAARAQSYSIESANEKDAKGQPDHRLTLRKDLTPNRSSLPKTKRPMTVPRNSASSRSATAFHFRQPGSSRSSGGEERSLLQQSTLKNTAPVRQRNIIGPSPATVSHARHNSPNPAMVGGLVNSTKRPGEISGSLTVRRH